MCNNVATQRFPEHELCSVHKKSKRIWKAKNVQKRNADSYEQASPPCIPETWCLLFCCAALKFGMYGEVALLLIFSDAAVPQWPNIVANLSNNCLSVPLSFGLRSKLLSNWPAIDGTRLFIERLSHRRRDGP